MHSGFILQPTYRVREDGPVVRLFGRLESGEAFLVEDDRFRHYFFVPKLQEAALAADAAPIFPTHGDNRALRTVGDERCDPTTSERVVRGRYVNQRVAVVPIEPDRAAAEVDGRNLGCRGRICRPERKRSSAWTATT